MDMFVSRLQGMSIPMARVEYLQWSVTATSNIEVTIEQEAEMSFMLQQQVLVTFTRKLFKIGEKDGIVVDQASMPYFLEKESLLSSALFGALSEKSAERLQSVLHEVSKYTGRVKRNEQSLHELYKLIAEADAKDNDQVKHLNKQLRICNKKLAAAMEELHLFEQKKSATIVEGELTCQDLSIVQARQTKFWQEVGAEDFYNKIMDEECSGNFSSVFENMPEEDKMDYNELFAQDLMPAEAEDDPIDQHQHDQDLPYQSQGTATVEQPEYSE